MRILHICSYYIGNKLYMNLFKRLSDKGYNQDVFIPIKDEKFIGSNQLPSEYNVNYFYKNILKKYDKFLYHHKINKQMKEIENSIPANESVDFIHAHTVFSDGGTAYKLHRKNGTKYIVNVRNTDINFFYKYAIHLRPFMYKIMINASAIVFISHAYKTKTLSLLPADVLSQIEDKCLVFPNGIDDFWHEQALPEKRVKLDNEIKLLFIGLIDENKNLGAVVSACAELNKKGHNVSLDIVGNGPLEEKNKALCKELNIEDKVTFHGYIKDNEKILSIMDKCSVFVMPSYRETFGLVYIEAMSRGIPVIFSKGEGIDGFYDEGEVGFSVDPNRVETITESVEKILQNYDRMSALCIDHSKSFNWDSVSNQYIEIYQK